MSSVDITLRVFRQLEPEDIKILTAIEIDLSRYRFVPETDILRISGLDEKEVKHRLERLNSLGLIYRWIGPYVGYILNTAGYDCLALNALVKTGVLESIGKPLGVGKESDVYDALTQRGERAAVKFHRLGRISFRQVRRLRGYLLNRRHASWLYKSRLAAEREIEALKLVYPHGVSVPKPIGHNRHVVVMGVIEGECLFLYTEISNPEKVLDEILENVKKAYIRAGVIHGDLSEFNIILTPDQGVLVIDWPQFIKTNHPNADEFLERDIKNVLRFFKRKYGITRDLEEVLSYIRK